MTQWLVAGAGAAGLVHARSILRIPDAGLVGLVSSKATSLGDTPVFPTLEDALARSAPDAVIIATPNHTHRALAATAADAGIAVLCEKPAGRSSREAEAMIATARSAGTPLGIVLNQRFCRYSAWLRQLIADGLRVKHIGFDVRMPPLGGWQMDPDRSGGGLFRLIGVHYVDLMRWWLGEPAAEIVEIDARMSGGPAETEIDVAYGFPGGVTATLTIGPVTESSGAGVSCAVDTERGSVRFAGHRIVDAASLPEPPAAEAVIADQPFGPGHAALLVEATVSLREQNEFPVSLAAALPTLTLVDRTYEAASRPVSHSE